VEVRGPRRRHDPPTYELRVDLGRVLGAVFRGPIIGILRAQLIESMPGKLKRDIEG